MLRRANAQTVVRECHEAVFVDSDVRARIVEVIELQIPITVIEAHTVGQYLGDIGSAFRGFAVGRRHVEGGRYGNVLPSGQLLTNRATFATYALKCFLREVRAFNALVQDKSS